MRWAALLFVIASLFAVGAAIVVVVRGQVGDPVEQCGDGEAIVTLGEREYSAIRGAWGRAQVETAQARRTVDPCRRAITLWTLRGVPERVALSPERSPADRLYVADGSLMINPRHPLYRAIEGVPLDLRKGARCGRRQSFTGPAREIHALGLFLRVQGTGIRVDSRTRARDVFLQEGERVTVDAVVCADSRNPVATRIVSRRAP